MSLPGAALPALVGTDVDLSSELEHLYVAHRTDVYKIALRYGGGRAGWAEDVVQEVFLSLGRALPSLVERGDLMGWLYRVTTRRCLNRLQADRVRALFSFRARGHSPGATVAEPEAIADARSELSRALAAVSILPPKERVAFLMHRLDGATLDEIGEVLGHRKSYVSRLVSRAEARLREVLR